MSFCVIPATTWAVNSSDAKPTKNVPDGQVIIEKDTGKCFIWDQETKTWNEL